MSLTFTYPGRLLPTMPGKVSGMDRPMQRVLHLRHRTPHLRRQLGPTLFDLNGGDA